MSLYIIYYHWYFWYFGNYARKPLALANSRNTTFGKKLVKLVVGEGKTMRMGDFLLLCRRRMGIKKTGQECSSTPTP